jgi:cell division septation protein DedD
MASAGEPVRPASASATTGETIPKHAGTPDPTFPRFLSAMSAARQAGTLHHLTPSDDQAHSLPLNAAVSDNSMPQTGSVFATWLFVSLCLTIIAIAFIVVAHSRFPADSETYAPIDDTESKEKIEIDDLQVNPMPRVSDVTPGKDVRAKTSAVSAEVRSVQPHNDQHATTTAGLRRGADETTGDPGDPIGVTLARASAQPGPSAAVASASQVQAGMTAVAIAFQEARRTPAIEAVEQNSEGRAEYRVQLAAMSAETAAERMWLELLSRHGEILRSKRPMVEHSGELHLLQVGPFDTISEASMACAELKERGDECLLVRRRR